MQQSTRILIVDDDKSILRSLSRILENCGYQVETVENGKEALGKIKSIHFNLLLVDIRLPDMNGTDLLTKAKNEIKAAVKIMITGFPSLETGVKSLEEGADAYLVKPVQPKELLSVIESKLTQPSNECSYHYIVSGESLDFPL
jgi:DNA-binding response OmpR family regulator